MQNSKVHEKQIADIKFIVSHLIPEERAALIAIAGFEPEEKRVLKNQVLPEVSTYYKDALSLVCDAAQQNASQDIKHKARLILEELRVSQEKAPLESLPQETLLEISTHLPVKSRIAFLQTSKVIHAAMFKQPLLEQKIKLYAARLLQHTMDADPKSCDAFFKSVENEFLSNKKSPDETKKIIGQIILEEVPGEEAVYDKELKKTYLIRAWPAVSSLVFVFYAGDVELAKNFLEKIPPELMEKALQQLVNLVKNGTKHGKRLAPLGEVIDAYQNMVKFLNTHCRQDTNFKTYLLEIHKKQLKLPLVAILWFLTDGLFWKREIVIDRHYPPEKPSNIISSFLSYGSYTSLYWQLAKMHSGMGVLCVTTKNNGAIKLSGDFALVIYVQEHFYSCTYDDSIPNKLIELQTGIKSNLNFLIKKLVGDVKKFKSSQIEESTSKQNKFT